MARVWQAKDELTGGLVALKEILNPDDELIARFRREASACSTLRHQNIAGLMDARRIQSRGYALRVMRRDASCGL